MVLYENLNLLYLSVNKSGIEPHIQEMDLLCLLCFLAQLHQCDQVGLYVFNVDFLQLLAKISICSLSQDPKTVDHPVSATLFI